MKLNYLNILFLLICFSCRGQSVSENDIYDAVNDIIEEMEGEEWIKEGKPNRPYILDKPSKDIPFFYDADELFKREAIKEYFSDNDKAAFEKQLKLYYDFVYREGKVRQKKLILLQELEKISGNNFWELYIDKYGEAGFYDISVPLFSANKQMMLVLVKSCTPYSCHTEICVFMKVDEKWKKQDTLYLGI